jgi:hypothetical protein
MTKVVRIDGTDRTSVVRLDSIVVEMKAQAGEVGAGTLAIDDTTGTATPAPAMTKWVIKDNDADPKTIGAGFIAEREVNRGPLTVHTQRQFEPVLEDMNAALGDRVLRGIKSKRPKETDVERVRWLLRSKGLKGLVKNGQVPSGDAVDMDKADYRGRYPFEVLQDCAEESDRDFFVYYDEADEDWALCYDTAAIGDSTLKVSDRAADVDHANVYAPSNIEYELDPGRIYSAIYVKWRDGFAYARRAATQTAFRRHEKTVTRNRFRSAKRARNWARKQLTKLDTETTHLTLTVSVPGSALGQLRAGMRIQVKLASRGITAYTYFRIVGVTISPRQGDGGNATDVEYDVRLEMRDKVRVVDLSANSPRGGSDKAGSGKDDQGETARIAEYKLDDFGRTVAPPGWETGDSIGSDITKWGIYTEFLRYGAGATWPGQGTLHEEGPTTYGPYYVGSLSAMHGVSSFIGSKATGWTQQVPGVSPCGGWDFWFAGWEDRETWYKFTVPAHPAGMAGITGTLQTDIGAAPSAAAQAGIDVVALGSAPTTTWEGTVIGNIQPGGNIVFLVPGAMVPAEGGEMWIGLRPAWKCNYGEEYCGWSWPQFNGAGNSGRFFSPPWVTGLAWATWTTAGTSLGSAAVVDEAPWEGGNAWHDGGIEGSPVYGMDGSSYYVEAEAESGHGMDMLGPGEDEDEPGGPWGDGWMLDILFTVDAHGAGTGGPRTIEVRTTGDLWQTVGTVHLGDATRAEGISVAGPTTTDYVAKALTLGEKWTARFDSRSGRMRGKLWKVGDRMPAKWDVEVDIDETTDDGDRFELWTRVGNGAGNSQKVNILRLDAAQMARDDQRIVRERIGFANGDEHIFKPSHQFREETLRFYVNGVKASPDKEWDDDAKARLDGLPTKDMMIRATYIVD